MTTSYASVRSITPGITIGSASGGNLTAGSLWISVQAQTRAGRNLLSTPVQVTWDDGDKVQVVIGADARETSETDIVAFVVSGAATNTPTDMLRLASWYARDAYVDPVDSTAYPGQGTSRSLPHTIELTEDAHVALNASVATPAALPTGDDLIQGAIRLVNSLSEYWLYDAEAETGEQAAAAGYWVLSSQSELETYLASTTEERGCDRPISELSDLVLSPPVYRGDGSDSYAIQLWFTNGLVAGAGPIYDAGTPLSLQTLLNGNNKSTVFARRVIATLLGYVDRETGELNTSVPGVGSDIELDTSDSGTDDPRLGTLELPLDLEPGQAAAYEFRFRFKRSELGVKLRAGDRFTLRFDEDGILGFSDSAWYITGDVVLNAGDKMRVVPASLGVLRKRGRCIVKGFRTPNVREQFVSGFTANLAAQKVCISAALGGDCIIRQPAEALGVTDAIRAVVSTEAGTYVASSWQPAVNISGTNIIQVSTTYPTGIRSDYPDVVAGMSATFNAPQVRVFIRFGGTIYEMPTPVSPTLPDDTILISTISGWATVGSLPTSPSADFGLFGYGAISAISATGSGTLTAGSYEVAIAWHYPSPNTAITKISHSTSVGCIPELEPLTTATEAGKYWAAPLATIAAMLALEGTPDNQYRWNDEVGYRCRYDAGATDEADGITIFEPDDGMGRWFAEIPILLTEFYSFS